VWWRKYEERRREDFATLMIWIMGLDAKLDEIRDRLEEDDEDGMD
jgi:hypothetical protein